MNIKLTKSQIENLIEFFELEFIDSIRNDADIDNIEYICEMCEIYRTLQTALKERNNEISNDKHTA